MKNKDIIKDLLDKNKIILGDINNLSQDYRDLLDISNTLIYKDCDKLKINITSKINHLSLYNCTNSTFYFKTLLTGFDLKNSKNITIRINGQKTITGLIELYNCRNIKIKLSRNNYNKSIIKISHSTNIEFFDFKNKIIDKIK